METKPILFSGPMVRALLAGRKTQTRRVLKPTVEAFEAPKYRRGDRLWVREAHYLTDDGESEYAVFAEDEGAVSEHLQQMQTTMASHPNIDWSKHVRLRPSIHMPRWASRLTLTVTDVRVQRVQEISEADANAEGVQVSYGEPFDSDCTINDRRRFQLLWDDLNAPRGFGWDANPWVAAYTFVVAHGNVDEVAT